MRISVIIASLNSAEVIARCITSVLAQDYPDVEVVVADGLSRDGTQQVLSSFSEQIIWWSEADEGLADAWNKAVARTSGQWLLFLGSDDSLAEPTVLRRMAPILSGALAAGHKVVFGDAFLTNAAGEVVGRVGGPWAPETFRRCISFGGSHQAVFQHRSLFDEFGPFDGSFKITLDWDFLLRHLNTADALYVPDMAVACMQMGGVSSRRDRAVAAVLELIRMSLRHRRGIAPQLLWMLVKSVAIQGLYAIGGDGFALRMTNVYRQLVGGRPPLRY